MTYAIIENNLVTNIIAADSAFAAEIGAVELPNGFGIGDSFDGETWTMAERPELPPPPELPPTDLLTAKVEKLAEISKACESAITAGCSAKTLEGNEHFSLTPNDQINLSANYTMVMQGATHALYHADNKLCRMFTADEITAVMTAATLHKTYHTTYCNHLNIWINRCETVAEISEITYGATLPDDLQSHMSEILGVAANE